MAKKRKKWTSEDDKYLRTHLDEPVSLIAKTLECSNMGVYMRMNRLGLRRTNYTVGSHGRAKKLLTLCEICKRADASSYCPWVDHFEPVPGWTAKTTEILNPYNGKPHYTPSYKVIACPLYIPDERKEEEG